jgi:hypothetical protein
VNRQTAFDLPALTTEGGSSNKGIIFALTPGASPGSAWSETILHNFAGHSDGASPQANLLFGGNGAIYSTTAGGGAMGLGTVFELTF